MKKINWYPGHMVKTKRQIKENLKYIDVVFELIDARIPYSSKIKDFEINDKKKILIATKYDLCNQAETDKWLKEYQEQGYHVLTFNLLKDNLNRLLKETENIMTEKIKKDLQKGLLKRKIRVMVIGVPNVGKSTLINRLVAKKATKVGNKPGVTTNLNWIRINEKLELLDTPGILWPKLEQEREALNLASFTSIKATIFDKEAVAVYIVKQLINYYPKVINDRYKINSQDYLEVIDLIAEKRNCLVKGEIDYEKVYDIIINDVQKGYIKNITFDIKE